MCGAAHRLTGNLAMAARSMWLELIVALIGLPLLIKGQVRSVTVTRTTPIDVITGGVVCPNLHPVEFTCVGIEVSFLEWRRNQDRIDIFTADSSEGTNLQPGGPLTLFLDSITKGDERANMTSRLVGNISNLISGDIIICDELSNREDMVILNYTLKASPPIVPTNFLVSNIETDIATVNISITWDSAFNLVHNVTSYSVNISNGASCPFFCDANGPCKCTGLRVGESTTITISAINCGDQMGPPVPIVATPRVPFRPTECSALPLYSSIGDLSAVDLTWTVVNDLPEFLPGVSQDVTSYYIAVDMSDSMTIPASTACSPLCSYAYPLQSSSLPNSPLSISVAANNAVGRGQMCTPQTEIGSRNQVFSLILDTTIPGNQTVTCTQLSGGTGTFECEFCYSVGYSCQNLTTCISVNGTPTLLSSLTELTYCYRATANVNGIAVAVIQDTFNTACPRDVLGTAIDEQTNSRCNLGTLRSVSIPNGVGCVNGDTQGSLTTYQCDKWYTLSGGSHRTCMSDGNWDGEVPECEINGGVITLLVLSILAWIAATSPTVVGVVLVKKEVSLKETNLFNFQILLLWRKVTYVVLLVIEFPFLLIVFLLWIGFSVILDNPNSESQQTSLLIAAFVLALLALLWIIVALVFLYVATKCSSAESVHQAGVQAITKSDLNTSKATSIPVYAVPDKSKKRRPPEEEDEHRPDPDNKPKSKGFIVNKKAKVKAKKEPLEDIELNTQRPAYDKFEGLGHHLDKPIPKSPVIAENYDVLNVEGQRNGNDHTSGSQGTYSIPGEAEREYSEVDKRSSQKRLLA